MVSISQEALEPIVRHRVRAIFRSVYLAMLADKVGVLAKHAVKTYICSI